MNDTLSRLAFAIQDKDVQRLQAQRIARTVLAVLKPGDDLGRGLVVGQKSEPDARDDRV